MFADKQLITPDQVQGKHKTLRAACSPTAGRSCAMRAVACSLWTKRPRKWRSIAASGARSKAVGCSSTWKSLRPAAAYITLNEPLQDAQRIREAVESGFIVRTRADADTRKRAKGKTERRETALRSGAQYVSTDYMQPDPRFGKYSVRLPDGVTTVCNPVRAQKRCGGHAVK